MMLRECAMSGRSFLRMPQNRFVNSRTIEGSYGVLPGCVNPPSGETRAIATERMQPRHRASRTHRRVSPNKGA